VVLFLFESYAAGWSLGELCRWLVQQDIVGRRGSQQ
jgi:hypothetical protein